MPVNKPVNIAFIITGLAVGGAETMLLKLLERLDHTKFRPMVISLTTEGDIGRRIASLGIPVVALGMRPAFPSPFRFLRLVGLVRQFRPDIVHTWMYHADLIGGLAARLAGRKRVIWGIRHSNLSKKSNKHSTLFVVRLCSLLSSFVPSHILSCSDRARDIHVNYGYSSQKMSVIPNGFDLQSFQPNLAARSSVRMELGLALQTPLVGLIGRFHPQKNHLGFIEAASLIFKQRPDVLFLLAGTEVDQKNQTLTSAIEQAGLTHHFHLLGRREDMPRLMASLDLLASSSDGEAFPNVLGEAMACEVPCVVTDVGDSVDIVGNTGRVVAAGDMKALADEVCKFLSLPQKEKQQSGLDARARVAERYEIGKIVMQYQNFYHKMCKDNS